MAGFTTQNTDYLIRSDVWSRELKDVLYDELMGTKYVRFLTEFPDGDTFHIPSIGQMEVLDYVEGNPILYTNMDTGEFTFSIDQYKSSATYITNKMKQESFYMNELVSQFVPKQARALGAAMENKILAVGPDGQTASNLNVINGANHRFVGSGTNETMGIKDFQLARYALQKANVPLTNLVAIVDPSVEYTIGTLTNLINLSFNPRWEGIVSTSIGNDTKFFVNVLGWDVYISNRLKDVNETIGGLTTAAGKANLFFSAASDVLPFVGLIKQPPRVESEYNKDFQREEYVTTCRYGFKLYRPENMVVILTDNDQVA